MAHSSLSISLVIHVFSTRVESGSASAAGNFLSSSAAASEVPMYCKSKIYAGVREMSFEELRAVAWFKRKQEQEQLQSQVQLEVQRQLQLALKRFCQFCFCMDMWRKLSCEAVSFEIEKSKSYTAAGFPCFFLSEVICFYFYTPVVLIFTCIAVPLSF